MVSWQDLQVVFLDALVLALWRSPGPAQSAGSALTFLKATAISLCAVSPHGGVATWLQQTGAREADGLTPAPVNRGRVYAETSAATGRIHVLQVDRTPAVTTLAARPSVTFDPTGIRIVSEPLGVTIE